MAATPVGRLFPKDGRCRAAPLAADGAPPDRGAGVVREAVAVVGLAAGAAPAVVLLGGGGGGPRR